MQLFSTLAAVATAAAFALVLAEQEVHIKVHVDKFYVTPIGQQCAFNSCVDPSVYPCANGACVRLNYTYGICSNNPADKSAEESKLLCPYPNPYNSKLGSLGEEDDEAEESGSYDSYDSYDE